ncbi:LysM peptidoglycan-binding domain-containing protein [Amphibacillus indicireducens]|uniref:Stage VI sporulation protein D n=1 Tax=Amphibacillus indicireducens TaxID=1076330 RepID=A0ABP7V9T0_9BACI
MADKEVKPFHFDLTETLFFHRNEGVSEMLGIGLDPEITIESHPDHVSIRGIIALTGEYLPEFVADQTEVDDDDEVQMRYFKRVERDEDGICEFLHHFPIDISIPHERISQLSDLTVKVDHFDYHIADPRKLELEATVQIGGLEYDREAETEEEPAEDLPEEEDEEADRVQFDLKIKEDQPDDEIGEEVAEEKEEEEKVVPFKKREQPKPDVKVEAQNEIREVVDEDDNTDEVESEVERTIDDRVEHPTYLLDLFEQSGESDERFAQMKMYIVQDQDSLEQISEKYQVNLVKLQRMNRLDSTDIQVGQIIYIPN